MGTMAQLKLGCDVVDGGGCDAEGNLKMKSALAVKPLIINVVAVCYSLHKASFNYSLLRSAIDLSKQSVEGMSMQYVDLSPLPMLNTNLEIDYKYPPPVETDRNFFLNTYLVDLGNGSKFLPLSPPTSSYILIVIFLLKV
ncbi:hypothetical protein L6452_21806 [Arctium lappa]|uniref:Uncharacterized protein n=1 Tax=Arctium lappa TaxID=4217 RepID=A0ACB9AY35_ARCLA|nr:hypothetical protein L6452_21806 [Arctium lappa]